MSANAALGVCTGQRDSLVREAQAVQEASDERLTQNRTATNWLAKFFKWLVASDLSVQELTAGLQEVKSQLLTIT